MKSFRSVSVFWYPFFLENQNERSMENVQVLLRMPYYLWEFGFPIASGFLTL